VVVLISTNNCMGCNKTKHHLKSKGVPFFEYSSTDDTIMNMFGHFIKSFPTVVVFSEGAITHWSGFSEEKLNEIP